MLTVSLPCLKSPHCLWEKPKLLSMALTGFSEQPLLTLPASGKSSLSEWLPPFLPELLSLCDLRFLTCNIRMMEATSTGYREHEVDLTRSKPSVRVACSGCVFPLWLVLKGLATWFSVPSVWLFTSGRAFVPVTANPQGLGSGWSDTSLLSCPWIRCACLSHWAGGIC